MPGDESAVRQNYHTDCEVGINKQINLELHASYVYQAMAAYFSRDDVELPGFAKFFSQSSVEEREHAEIMIKFQNDRGGRVIFNNIEKPPKDEWGKDTYKPGLEALEDALALEKQVNTSLLDLHKVASDKGDPHMCDWLEDNFLKEQVKSIRELSGYITQLNKVGPGLGEYLFDQHTLKGGKD